MRYFYGALLLFLGLWIAFFKPYEVHKQQPTDSMLFLSHFLYQELDTNQTRLELRGEEGRYVKNSLVVDMPRLVDRRKKERIEAQKGSYEAGTLVFEGDVRFWSKTYSAKSQKAIYMTKEKILRIPAKFWLYAKDMNVTGKNLVYYKSSGKIVAYNIEAKVLQ